MFKRILVALDGSPASEQALKLALALAHLTGASLTALSVEEKLPAYAATVGEVQEAKGEIDAYFTKVHTTAQERARAAGVALHTAVRAGHAAQTIARFAEQGSFDLIVLGAGDQHGLGSTADKVTEIAPCSVLIARAVPLSVRVGDVMSTDVVTVGPATQLAQVVEILVKRAIKAVPVIDGGRIVGIITGGDLIRRAGMGLRLSIQRRLPADELTEQLHQFARQGGTAAEVMTSPVVTIPVEARVSEAARLMADKHLKRLPVVDKQGMLVGIVSRTDVLTTVASVASVEEELPAALVLAPHTAGDLMFRDVPTVSPDTPLNEVLDKLIATPLRRIVVVDESRRVLGIILDADLLARISPREHPGTFRALLARLSYAPVELPLMSGRAVDVMSHDVFSVREDTPLVEVIQTMLEKHVKRLVVTDVEGRLSGVVDRQSLLRIIGNGG